MHTDTHAYTHTRTHTHVRIRSYIHMCTPTHKGMLHTLVNAVVREREKRPYDWHAHPCYVRRGHGDVSAVRGSGGVPVSVNFTNPDPSRSTNSRLMNLADTAGPLVMGAGAPLQPSRPSTSPRMGASRPRPASRARPSSSPADVPAAESAAVEPAAVDSTADAPPA
jgi:hypothetical protein